MAPYVRFKTLHDNARSPNFAQTDRFEENYLFFCLELKGAF